MITWQRDCKTRVEMVKPLDSMHASCSLMCNLPSA